MSSTLPIETLQLPNRAVTDMSHYREEVGRFQRGEINETAFRAFRVPMGVYEHRQSGQFMVRVRLGAGIASAAQLERIAELASTHGNGVLHVTTRQDVQIHQVSLEGTVAIQDALLAVGLSARGGGGNTVRNVTACPRASVCPKATFDVTPSALATAEYLLQLPSSYNLPRKFKIAFSGCADDCAFAAVNDLGFFAHVRDGVAGYAVYAAGGLGAQATPGVRIEELILPGDVFAVAEAVERLFDRLGDRTNKNQARLRYVVRRLGAEAFVAEYRKEREALASAGLVAPLPQRKVTVTPDQAATSAERPTVDGFLSERNPMTLTLYLQLHNGHIPAADLIKVARIATELGHGFVVATQQQDLLIPGIPVERVDAARSALAGLSIDARWRGTKVVACAGASTCKLGLCHSPALADAIYNRLRADNAIAGHEVIRLSGCPNACGNHPIAALGFEGRARRHEGRLMPLYEVLAGGQSSEGQVRMATRLGAVPARVIPDLVAEIRSRNLRDTEEIRPVVARFARLPDKVPESFFIDHGSSTPFSLAGRGPGECGAGVLDIIRVDLQEADDALAASEAATPKRSFHVYRAVAASARALLPLFGVEARKEREIFKAASESLIAPGWVESATEALFAAALDWRLGDRAELDDCRESVRQFHRRIRELFASLDNSLHFRLEPLARAVAKADAPATVRRDLDLRGVACPMNFVKAKVALEKMSVGEEIEVLLDGGDPARNVPASFREQGQDVLTVEPDGQHFRVRIKRKK